MRKAALVSGQPLTPEGRLDPAKGHKLDSLREQAGNGNKKFQARYETVGSGRRLREQNVQDLPKAFGSQKFRDCTAKKTCSLGPRANSYSTYYDFTLTVQLGMELMCILPTLSSKSSAVF